MEKTIAEMTLKEVLSTFKDVEFWVRNGYLYVNGNAYPFDMELVEEDADEDD